MFISTSLLSDVTAVSATHLRHGSLSAPIFWNLLLRHLVRIFSCASFRGHSLRQSSGKPHIKIMVDRRRTIQVDAGLRKVDRVIIVSFEGGVLMCFVYSLVSPKKNINTRWPTDSRKCSQLYVTVRFSLQMCARDKMAIESLQSPSCKNNL